jgi:hypothetical protein
MRFATINAVLRKCCISFTLSVLAFAAKSAAAAGVTVLFVGNSLLYMNDLPTQFKKFAAASSLRADVDVRSITAGGATLSDHWKRGEALARLREWHPKFLVLQGQSTEPVSAPQNFSYYARLFKDQADALHTRTVLFATWARPASDPFYKEAVSGGSPVEMQTRLNSAYASLAQNIGATLAPIGVAFEQAKHDAPTIHLRDGTQHPSPAGTYLATAVLFRTIFNSSALGSTYYGGLPETTAHTLQRIADTVPLTATR